MEGHLGKATIYEHPGVTVYSSRPHLYLLYIHFIIYINHLPEFPIIYRIELRDIIVIIHSAYNLFLFFFPSVGDAGWVKRTRRLFLRQQVSSLRASFPTILSIWSFPRPPHLRNCLHALPHPQGGRLSVALSPSRHQVGSGLVWEIGRNCRICRSCRVDFADPSRKNEFNATPALFSSLRCDTIHCTLALTIALTRTRWLYILFRIFIDWLL